ncbi:MAG: hypothetical protein IPJ71_18915 [Bdellovibrionales bacterium]|nr:hypothetical protein [Bdellovibrionales bacterium]
MVRSIFLSALILVMTLGVSEGVARIVSKYLGIPQTVFQTRTYRFDSQLEILQWAQDMKPHPLFGFMREKNLSLIGDAREHHPANEFRILLLGGSVAEIFGDWTHFEEILKQRISGLRNLDVRLLNLATGGYKQPQQFFILSYLIDQVDLVINIDGFNELMSHDDDFYSPLEYPIFWNRYFSENSFNYGLFTAQASVRYLYQFINFLPQRFEYLSSSRAFYFFWSNLRTILVNSFSRLERLNRDKLNEGRKLMRPPDDVESIGRKNLAVWKKYQSLSAMVAKSRNLPYISFVQPNQYLEGSKSLSYREIENFINPAWAAFLNPRMKMLSDTADELAKSGLPVRNLMWIFKNEQQDLYIDSCCHFNDLGNKIMENAILDEIQKVCSANRNCFRNHK